MASNSFSLDLRKFIAKAKDGMDKVARMAVLDIGNRLIEASPVGDPTNWKDPPPPGYVGGAFRNSWSISLEGTPTAVYGNPNKTGADSKARLTAGVPTDAAGRKYYIANTQPYAVRLEQGWSYMQAPLGIVGLTVFDWTAIVDAAVGKVKEGTA